MPKTDYLTFVNMPGGGGSYARGTEADPVTVARRCVKIARADWSRLFKIPENHEWSVHVVDMTGHDNARFGPDGAFDADTDERLTVETIKIIGYESGTRGLSPRIS